MTVAPSHRLPLWETSVMPVVIAASAFLLADTVTFTSRSISWLLTAGGISMALGACVTLFRAAWQAFRRIDNFVDDWYGQPPGKPGVVSQLDTLNRRTEQLEPNGGSSLVDAVGRLERAIATAAAERKDLRESLRAHLADHPRPQ